MKRKLVTLLLALSIATISITACGNKTDNNTEPTEMVNEIESLPWLQLSSLESHPELRAQFDEFFGITGTVGNKEGKLYYNVDTQKADQNVTLYMALKNEDVNVFFSTETALEKLSNIAAEHYADVEADDLASAYATINAYFELLPDQEAGQFDGEATISRAQAMTLLMRATTQVNEAGAPETDKDFTSKVGKSQYTDFAAPMDKLAYINTKTGLNEDVFNSAMTRAEYIALVTNYLTANYEGDVPKVEITVITDGGSEITYSDAIKDASTALPTDLYNTLSKAVALGLIDESALEDWDSSITKSEAIEYFVNMTINMSMSTNELSDDELADSGMLSDEHYDDMEAGIREMEEIDAYGATLDFGGNSGTHNFKLWAKSQGADTTSGWTFLYYNGEAAGSQPSYGVYMKPDSPLYGTVYHVGDYLPDGTQFEGTMQEFMDWQAEQAVKKAQESGNYYKDEETGKDVIVIGGGN